MVASERPETKVSNLSKSTRVRAMFAEIAPRYDFLNHALSLNIDRSWRRSAVRSLEDVITRPGARALDLCCGTCDLSLELSAFAPTLAVDFCHPMLKRAQPKIARAAASIYLVEGDALRVPFQDETFDAVTIAFGLRNLEHVEPGLAEIFRLLRPGGRAAILEFTKPKAPVFRQFFQFYFNRLLPVVGNAISGSRFAYKYLPDSVLGFPNQDELARMMRTVGFFNVEYYNLSLGIAALHVGERPQGSVGDERRLL